MGLSRSRRMTQDPVVEIVEQEVLWVVVAVRNPQVNDRVVRRDEPFAFSNRGGDVGEREATVLLVGESRKRSGFTSSSCPRLEQLHV